MQRKTEIYDNFQPEIVTFGETMALMTPEGTKGIEYASRLEYAFGGAESNVAIGIARLGHRAGWFGKLGADPFGRNILKRIRGEGVDVSRSKLVSDFPTGFMLRENVAGLSSVYYYRKNSAASTMLPEDLDESYIAQSQILHVTGITAALSEYCLETMKAAMRIARKNGVKVSFDPNVRLKLWSPEKVREHLVPLIMHADYFLPGINELEILYQTTDLQHIFSKLQSLSAISIVKGETDAYIIEPGARIRKVPYFKVDQIIDPVGAGDAFCAGFLTGLLKHYPLEDAVRLGNLLGSQVIQFQGDWEGLPTWEKVESICSKKAHVER